MFTEIRRLTDDRRFATEVVFELNVASTADLMTIANRLRSVIERAFAVPWCESDLNRVTALGGGRLQLGIRFAEPAAAVTEALAGTDPTDLLVTAILADPAPETSDEGR